MSIPVRNRSGGPLFADGAGVLVDGEFGHAEKNDHTFALLDAGLLIEGEPDITPLDPEPEAPAKSPAAKRGKNTNEEA